MLHTLLFVIFGGTVREKDYGEAYPVQCPNCDNGSLYHLYKTREWFHIFWIPLIPFRSNKFLVCPICMYSIDLSRAGFKHAKVLAADTERLFAGEITTDEYAETVYEFDTVATFIDEPLELAEYREQLSDIGEPAPEPELDAEGEIEPGEPAPARD